MTYKSFDEDDTEYIDEPKGGSEHDENESNTIEDFQTIDAEIIDYGVCEDENKETLLSPKKPVKFATESSFNDFNSSNVCKNKLAFIKVVDCDRYPWYYAKYKKQILKRKYFNLMEDAKDMVNFLKDGIRNTFVTVDTIKVNDNFKIMKNNIGEENNETVDLCNTKLSTKSIETKCENANKMPDTKEFNKIMDTVKTIHKTNPAIIDLKKNKGLVGMKVQRMVENDKTKAKQVRQTTCNEIFTKQSVKNPNQLCTKESEISKRISHTNIDYFHKIQKDSNINTKKDQKKQSYMQPRNSHSEKGSSLKCSLRVPSQQMLKKLKINKSIQQDNSVRSDPININTTGDKNGIYSKETISYRNKIDGLGRHTNQKTNEANEKLSKYKPMPKSKRVAMEKKKNVIVENLKDMKNEKLKTIGVKENHTLVKDNLKAVPEMYSLTKNCESSKSFIQMNKLTQKVFKIMDNLSKIENKSYRKEFLKTDTVQLKTTDITETIRKTKYSTFSDIGRLEHKYINSNEDNNIGSGDEITENENKMENNKIPITSNQNKNKKDISTIITKLVQDRKDYNYHRYIESSSKVDSIANIYRKQDIKTLNNGSNTGSNNDENSLISNEILTKPGNLKYSTNITTHKRTDEIHLKPQADLYNSTRKTNQIEKKKSKRKQPVKILAVETIENIEDYLKINQTTKASTQSIALASHDSSQSKQSKSLVQTTGRNKKIVKNNESLPNIIKITKHTPQNPQISAVVIRSPHTSNIVKAVPNTTSVSEPFNIKRPDVRIESPRTHLSLPLLPNPSQTVRNQVPFRQMHPWRNKMYQRPNYPPPFIHGGPQRMPFNANFQQGSHFMQNNYIQHPVYNNTSQIMSGNTNVYPGYYDVNTNNYWSRNYNYYNQNSAPPPPLPLPQNSFNQNHGSSIIGSNTNGVVKKIKIPTLSTLITDNVIDSKKGVRKQDFTERCEVTAGTTISDFYKSEMMKEVDKTSEIVSPNKTDLIKERCDIIVDTTTPVLSKSEMIKELDKATETVSLDNTDLIIESRGVKTNPATSVLSKLEMMKELEKAAEVVSPDKTDMKRPFDCKQSPDQTTSFAKSKPGPLSKKIKHEDLNISPPRNKQKSFLHSGYSPPILPIPTYENILSKVQAPAFDKQVKASNHSDSNFIVDSKLSNGKRKATLKHTEEGNLKRISLDEYKRKLQKHLG